MVYSLITKAISRVALAILLCSMAAIASATVVVWPEPAHKAFDAGNGKYMYATSSILIDDVEYHFYCTNKDAYVVRDHIGLTKVRHSDGVILAANQLVLDPSAEGWDARHVCDPTVTAGNFQYNGAVYEWAMFFLGEDMTDEELYGICTHNQIGVAFAHDLEGPWVKWDGNPIIPFASYYYWGIGQPSAFSLDGAGRIQLIYSQGDQNGTRMMSRPLDMSDMAALSIGPAKMVPTAGLTSIDGSNPILHNADYAYDPIRGRVFVTRPRHPFSTTTPDFVASELQIASMDYNNFLAGSGVWEVAGSINASNTGKARNHNSGILRTPLGRIAEPNRLTIAFCGSDEGGNWLYTYRIHSISGTLNDGIYEDFSTPYTADDNTVYLFHMDTAGNSNEPAFVANSASGGWGGWAADVAASGERFHTDSPSSAFGTSIYFSDGQGGTAPWPRVGIHSSAINHDASNPDIGNALSLEAWVKRETGASGALQRFISRDGAYHLSVRDDKLEIAVTFSDASEASLVSLASLPIGEWTHVAGVWDGGHGELSVWINGVKDNSQSISGKTGLMQPPEGDEAGIVWWFLGTGSGTDFRGYLDEVRVSYVARQYGDITPPKALLETAAGSTISGPVSVTAVLSESSTNFTADSLSVTNATINGFGGSGDSYSFILTPLAFGEVVVSIPADAFTDENGNGNETSNTLAFSYEEPDTDMDGLPDPWEMQYFETLDWSAYDDPDGDGNTNIFELRNGTNPNNALSRLPAAQGLGLGLMVLAVWGIYAFRYADKHT